MLWKCCTQYVSKFGKPSSGLGLEDVSFIPIPKKENAKECSKYWKIVLISHTNKFSPVQSLSRVRLFATPWTVTHQTPPSLGFCRQDTGVGCHFLLQEIFPTQGLNPGLPHCRQTLYHLSHQGSHFSIHGSNLCSHHLVKTRQGVLGVCCFLPH